MLFRLEGRKGKQKETKKEKKRKPGSYCAVCSAFFLLLLEIDPNFTHLPSAPFGSQAESREWNKWTHLTQAEPIIYSIPEKLPIEESCQRCKIVASATSRSSILGINFKPLLMKIPESFANSIILESLALPLNPRAKHYSSNKPLPLLVTRNPNWPRNDFWLLLNTNVGEISIIWRRRKGQWSLL